MVYPGSPAAAAGIQAGDRIVSIDGTEIDSFKAAIDAMNNVVPGAEVAVRVLRDEQADRRIACRRRGCRRTC